jgi:hypothetical protein
MVVDPLPTKDVVDPKPTEEVVIPSVEVAIPSVEVAIPSVEVVIPTGEKVGPASEDEHVQTPTPLPRKRTRRAQKKAARREQQKRKRATATPARRMDDQPDQVGRTAWDRLIQLPMEEVPGLFGELVNTYIPSYECIMALLTIPWASARRIPELRLWVTLVRLPVADLIQVRFFLREAFAAFNNADFGKMLLHRWIQDIRTFTDPGLLSPSYRSGGMCIAKLWSVYRGSDNEVMGMDRRHFGEYLQLQPEFGRHDDIWLGSLDFWNVLWAATEEDMMANILEYYE